VIDCWLLLLYSVSGRIIINDFGDFLAFCSTCMAYKISLGTLYVSQVPAPFKPDCAEDRSDSSNFARFADEDIVVGPNNEYAQLFAEF